MMVHVSNIKTVSDVLKNHESGNLSDVSELKDIKNLKGDEAYQADGKSYLECWWKGYFIPGYFR